MARRIRMLEQSVKNCVSRCYTRWTVFFVWTPVWIVLIGWNDGYIRVVPGIILVVRRQGYAALFGVEDRTGIDLSLRNK